MADNKKGCAVCCLLCWTAVLLALVLIYATLPSTSTLLSTSTSTSTSASSLAKHRIVTSGRCEDHGLRAVTSLDGCSSAAAQLALSDTRATATSKSYSTQSQTPLPPFCYIKPSNAADSQLYYVNNHSGPGKCTSERSCICSVPSAAEAGSGTSADPVPALVTSGRCEDHGLLAVTSVDGCSSAAAQLALSDTSAEASSRGYNLQSGTPVPPFCYIKPCNPEDGRLYYVNDHSGPGNCTRERVCICSVPPAAVGSGTPVSSPSSEQTQAEAICAYLPGAFFTSEQLGLNVECTFYCGDALLPGYPTDMNLHFADCPSIRADNCKSPCIEMANELYAPQTWLGVIVAYFFIFNTFCA